MCFTLQKSLLKILSGLAMIRLISIFLLILLLFGCSPGPCEDLRAKADSCLNEAIKSLLQKVASKKDEQECKDYLDSYYFSFSSRCDVSTTDVYGADSDDILISD